jgi:hypothetical protein
MTKQTEERDGWKMFINDNNIQVGRGRILFAEAVTFPDSQGRVHPAGWVLPGGRRTLHKDEAVVVATEINRITEEAEARAALSRRVR